MKAKFTFLVLIILFSFLQKINSQDFNLYNPSNELYLFSAYDEGANAFRYNPAVLGLGHRLNVTINVFLENYNRKVYLNEGDILLNTGSFGIAYRSFWEQNHERNRNLNQFSLGLGFGNKTISAGMVFEALFVRSEGNLNNFTTERETKYKLGFGILYRPAKFISTALTAKTNESLIGSTYSNYKYSVGLAVRPLSTDLLTLMSDFAVTPYYNVGLFDYNMLKAGIDVKVRNGFYLNGSYILVNNPDMYEMFTLGARFDFPHSSLRYNNPISRINEYSNYSEDYPFKSQGNHISLTYSLERRKSLANERKKILEITLSGSLQDYNTEDVFFGILGQGKRSIHEVIADIDYGANDPSVKAMLLKIYPLSTGRFEVNAAIEELARALERFKSRNKKITAYFPQDAGPGEYYVATFADDIVLPAESIFFYGLSIEVINYHAFLRKYGIDLQTFHAGKYKLTFQGLLDSTSEEGKEVINRMLDIIYEKMMNRVVVSRNITLDDYMRTKLSQPLTGSEALRLGLVDKNGWYSDAKDLAAKNSKTSNIVKSLNRSEWDNEWSEPEQIAIVGVYGSITTGESQPPPPATLPIPFVGGSRSTGSETVVRQLEDAFSNPKTKAVILRVDSGGGSALGSAEINSAIIRLKRKYRKPFIVSMGSAAASGGYYVSTSADKIFSDNLTITGSIGVFTARPNLDSLVSNQKVKVEIFKRGENSDIGSFFKALDKQEIEIIQGIIDYYYDRFVSAISEGRQMSKEEVEQVAQGRVWLGSDAYNKKLVDEIGGLYEAIRYAKKKSKLEKRYKLVYYAVPGGNVINEVITSSVIKYLQHNLTQFLGFGEDDDGLEIKY
jgi:protease-4